MLWCVDYRWGAQNDFLWGALSYSFQKNTIWYPQQSEQLLNVCGGSAQLRWFRIHVCIPRFANKGETKVFPRLQKLSTGDIILVIDKDNYSQFFRNIELNEIIGDFLHSSSSAKEEEQEKVHDEF